MRAIVALFAAFSILVQINAELYVGRSAAEWRSRTIYQLLTDRFAKDFPTSTGCNNLGQYCGGTWKGIQNNLDYIKNMGFNAIWITPIVKNYPGGYHGYWMTDLGAVNENFGTETDLHNMINAAHAKDIWVMVDVVANHVGPVDLDFSGIVPFNQAAHYHDKCQITNFQDQAQVELCRLSNLPDLNQENAYVNQTLFDWIHGTVQKFDFDGVRIDTVPEISKSFWPTFSRYAGVFTIGEVFDGRYDYVASYQSTQCVDGVLSYPLYFALKGVFGSRQSMNNIEYTWQQYQKNFKDLFALGTFIDNHDNARFLNSQSDRKLYENALTFTLMAQGIPIIYYGTEQAFAGGDDPANREVLWTSMNTNVHFYQYMKKINDFRNTCGSKFINEAQVQRYSADNFYAFTRGQIFVATTNVGSGNSVQYTIAYHPYADGTVLCNLWYPTTDCLTVQSGKFTIYLLNGESKIYHPQNYC